MRFPRARRLRPEVTSVEPVEYPRIRTSPRYSSDVMTMMIAEQKDKDDTTRMLERFRGGFQAATNACVARQRGYVDTDAYVINLAHSPFKMAYILSVQLEDGLYFDDEFSDQVDQIK